MLTSLFKRSSIQLFVTIGILFAITACSQPNDSAATSTAQEAKQQGLVIDNARARATFAMAKTGAAYFTLTNNTQNERTLVSVSAPQSVAAMTEIHETSMEDGMMQMQEIEEGVTVSAGATVEFTPGGKHLMLMGLQAPLEAGNTLTLTLIFDDDTQIEQQFAIVDMRK